jgi:hypothetical protein
MTPGKGDKKKPVERGAQRAALNRELLSEVRALQADLREMVERYELRVGGALNELVTRLEGDASIGQVPQPATIRKAKAMLELIREDRPRPRKARGKDFARLGRLVRRITDQTQDG